MTTCTSCGKESDTKGVLCASCTRDRLNATWKRQTRLYAVLILVGAGLFAYAIRAIGALPHGPAAEGIPPLLMWTAAIGGLGVLGGLFGLALAMFFNFLHRNK